MIKDKPCGGLSIVMVFMGCFLMGCATSAPGPDISLENIPPGIDPGVETELKKLYSDDARTRALSAHELGQRGERSAPVIPFLLGMLGDEARIESGEVDDDKQVFATPGQAAAFALAEIGEPSVAPLIKTLNSWDSIKRRNALLALGMIQDERALTPLLDALQDGNREVRKEAIIALGMLGDPLAVEPLIEIIMSEDKELRGTAKVSLRKITGAQFDADPADWGRWWEVKKVHLISARGEEAPDMPCPDDCRRMFDQGQLKSGITVEECVRIMCGCADVE